MTTMAPPAKPSQLPAEFTNTKQRIDPPAQQVKHQLTFDAPTAWNTSLSGRQTIVERVFEILETAMMLACLMAVFVVAVYLLIAVLSRL